MESTVGALVTHRLSVLSDYHVAELLMESVRKGELELVIVGAE